MAPRTRKTQNGYELNDKQNFSNDNYTTLSSRMEKNTSQSPMIGIVSYKTNWDIEIHFMGTQSLSYFSKLFKIYWIVRHG